MPHELVSHRGPQFLLSLTGSESEAPEFSDTANFLYDLNLLYELGRLAVDKNYNRFNFSHNAYRRNGRPLRSEHRQVLVRLKQESPIDVVTAISLVVGSASAIWFLTQSFEKLYNIKVNRKKTGAEIAKLNSETIKNLAEAEKISVETLLAVQKEWAKLEGAPNQGVKLPVQGTEASKLIEAVTKRMSESPIRITELRVEVVDHLDTQHGN